MVAVVRSVLGAAVVAVVINRRHPQPASEEAVRRHLTTLFCAVVLLLDAAVLLALVSAGADGTYLAGALPYLVATNACVAVVLRRAGRDLARTWAVAPHHGRR